MTKVRAPLSIDAALARIAGQLPDGWRDVAIAASRSESTVRAWGDPDKPDQIPFPSAIALDIAFQRAGGEGQPLFETYALQVKIAREHAFVDEVALARRACVLIREGAQAHEALVLASLPSASARERTDATRELEDVVREATAALALLASWGPAAEQPP